MPFVIGYNEADDGTTFMAGPLDKASVYGVTPIAQQSGGAAVVTTAITTISTTAATTTTPWGFSTSTQADAIPVTVNSIIARLNSSVVQGNTDHQALINFGIISGA